MIETLEILKYVLPALIVFATAFVLVRMFSRNEDKKLRQEMARYKKETTLPLRLQAYERLILFLERIAPEALVMRIGVQEMDIRQTLNELINSIRTEYEHNLVQQVYISSQGWELVKAAKNNMIKMVTEAAKSFKPTANGMLLSRQILEDAVEAKENPVAPAIDYLKREVRELF